MANQKILTCEAETLHPLLISLSLVYRIPWKTQWSPSDANVVFKWSRPSNPYGALNVLLTPYLTHLYVFQLFNPLQMELHCPLSLKNLATFCFGQRKIFPPNIDEERQKEQPMLSAGNNLPCCRQCQWRENRLILPDRPFLHLY